MKKFAVLTQYETRYGDSYEKIFDTQQEAIECADDDWSRHYTKIEKKHMEFFGVVAGEVDEYGCFDYGAAYDVIKEYVNNDD